MQTNPEIVILKTQGKKQEKPTCSTIEDLYGGFNQAVPVMLRAVLLKSWPNNIIS